MGPTGRIATFTSRVLLRVTHAVSQICWALHVVFSANCSHVNNPLLFHLYSENQLEWILAAFFFKMAPLHVLRLQSRATTQPWVCLQHKIPQHAVTIQNLNVSIRKLACLDLAWGWKVCFTQRWLTLYKGLVQFYCQIWSKKRTTTKRFKPLFI